ncbi:MAG: NAD(P)/FAD-dependent oxidoreductase, partial [Intestinibacter bartlettii]|nr:NAD(P)/FAD-dependent oxidoreductase [Intestinibacter bartlettii]
MAHYGNLQKIRNGKRTYAITPHIPGGFIKPDTLIKMGAVAKKYGGVMKVTSGQRILITNLQEEDLPAIWDELG